MKRMQKKKFCFNKENGASGWLMLIVAVVVLKSNLEKAISTNLVKGPGEVVQSSFALPECCCLELNVELCPFS